MRALICLAWVAVGAAVATAQTRPDPSVDLSVGYQVLHIPGQTYPLGMSLEVSGALTSIVRVVAEAGVSLARGTTSSYGAGTLTLYDYSGGPRVTARAGGVVVYGQLLGGGVRTHADLTTASGVPFIEGASPKRESSKMERFFLAGDSEKPKEAHRSSAASTAACLVRRLSVMSRACGSLRCVCV